MLISLFRWSYETVTGTWLRSMGVRRRALLVGDADQVARLRETLGSSRGGIDYDFVGELTPGPELGVTLARTGSTSCSWPTAVSARSSC